MQLSIHQKPEVGSLPGKPQFEKNWRKKKKKWEKFVKPLQTLRTENKY